MDGSTNKDTVGQTPALRLSFTQRRVLRLEFEDGLPHSLHHTHFDLAIVFEPTETPSIISIVFK